MQKSWKAIYQALLPDFIEKPSKKKKYLEASFSYLTFGNAQQIILQKLF